MAPPPGPDVVRLRRYLTGGGVAGNVAAGGVSQILAGVLAEKVTSVRAAEGGAAGEGLARFRARAPALVRHRHQAISARDYEDLALEASPAVAVVRALPATHPSGRAAPGWVTLRIVPWGEEPRPVASFELRRAVESFLDLRVPAQVRGRVHALAAGYFPVDVRASLATLTGATPGVVVGAAEHALGRFLHPLTGGPEGTGWRFGRDLYLSDLAALLESLDGVDYVDALAVGAYGTTAGNHLAVPLDRIIVAGTLIVTLAHADRGRGSEPSAACLSPAGGSSRCCAGS
jgi:predicted phage baseplate assembly protein